MQGYCYPTNFADHDNHGGSARQQCKLVQPMQHFGRLRCRCREFPPGVCPCMAPSSPHLPAFRITDGGATHREPVRGIVPGRRSAACPPCQRCASRTRSQWVHSVHCLLRHGALIVLHHLACRLQRDGRHCARRIFREGRPTLVPSLAPLCRGTNSSIDRDRLRHHLPTPLPTPPATCARC